MRDVRLHEPTQGVPDETTPSVLHEATQGVLAVSTLVVVGLLVPWALLILSMLFAFDSSFFLIGGVLAYGAFLAFWTYPLIAGTCLGGAWMLHRAHADPEAVVLSLVPFGNIVALAPVLLGKS